MAWYKVKVLALLLKCVQRSLEKLPREDRLPWSSLELKCHEKAVEKTRPELMFKSISEEETERIDFSQNEQN